MARGLKLDPIRLQPKQGEFLRAVDDYKVTFYGGAKGGGKSHGLRNVILHRRFQYPGTIGAVFRRTYPELDANIIRPLLMQHPQLEPFYNRSQHIITIPNGSTLEFCYCNTEADLTRYQGREFHDMGIEEAGQWPEEWFQRLRGSSRSSIEGIIARIMLTGNPGGIGHKWLKRLFIDRDYNEREVAKHYHFIQALVWDNAALIDNDPGYIDNLKAEPNEAIRKAYLEGDWDIFAGQYFGEWRREVHVLPERWKPEPWYKWFGAYDHGFAHPAMFGLFVVDGDGNVYLYREWGGNHLRVDQIARDIRDVVGPEWSKVEYIMAGHDCWSKQRDGGPTVAYQFQQLPKALKIHLIKANIDRIQGAQQVRDYLAHLNMPEYETQVKGQKKPTISKMKGPRFFVHPSCKRTIECLPRMIHDEKRPEDVMKVDATDADTWAGDDPYDMVRYGLMSRPPLSFKPQQPVKDTSFAWFKQRWAEEEKKAKRHRKPRIRRYGA